MTKKKLAFALYCSDEIAFSIGNIALSINKYLSGKEYDIVIFYESLTDEAKVVLSNIPKCTLRKLNIKEQCQEMHLKKLQNMNFANPDLGGAFGLIESFDLLHEYVTVIYLDGAIAIQGDISNLINFSPFGLVKNIDENRVLTVSELVEDEYIKRESEGVQKFNYLNSLLVISDSLMCWENMTRYCYKKFDEYNDKLKDVDKIILSLLVRDFGVQIVEVPWHDYMCYARHEFSALAKIVYFKKNDELWTDGRYLKAFPEWFRTHLKWLELGGDDFDRSNMSTKSVCMDLFEKIINTKVGESVSCVEAKSRTIKVTFCGVGSLCLLKLVLSSENTILTVFGIPLLNICKKREKKVIYLLKTIEIFKIKKRPGGGVIYVAGIPLFRLDNRADSGHT